MPAGAPSEVTSELPIDAEAMLDALADIVLVIDRLGAIRFVNRTAERELGYRREDRVGRSLLELIHPDDVANVVSSLETVQAKSVGTPVEVRVRSADGSWHWFEEIGTNIVLHDGSPAVLCAARNITQRRMWEVAAADVERARQIIHVAPTISLLLDGDGVVTSVNAAFTRMLGHDQGNVMGRRLLEFVVEGHDHDARTAFADLRAGASRVAFEAHMSVVGQAVDVRPVRFEVVNHLADPVIAGLVASGYDVTELQAAREELEHLARHDALTGLAGRAHLVRHVDRLLASGHSFALLYVDLDRFKPINDRWGHETGDDLLRKVAARLSEHVSSNPHDLVARVGGDEFVVIVSGIGDVDEAQRLAERIETVISAPYHLPVGPLRIGASVGPAIPHDTSTTDSLLADADSAMYRLKAGRRAASVKHRRIVVPRR